MLDLDLAGEFLVMASTLMYIKSRSCCRRFSPVFRKRAPAAAACGI